MPKNRIDNKPKNIKVRPTSKREHAKAKFNESIRDIDNVTKSVRNMTAKMDADSAVGLQRARRKARIGAFQDDPTGRISGNRESFAEKAARKATNNNRDMQADVAVAEKAFVRSNSERPDQTKFGFDKELNADGTIKLKKKK
jgi:hypothetical protein